MESGDGEWAATQGGSFTQCQGGRGTRLEKSGRWMEEEVDGLGIMPWWDSIPNRGPGMRAQVGGTNVK